MFVAPLSLLLETFWTLNWTLSLALLIRWGIHLIVFYHTGYLSDFKTLDAVFSEHTAILFDISVPPHTSKPSVLVCHGCFITSSSAAIFAASIKSVVLYSTLSFCQNTE